MKPTGQRKRGRPAGKNRTPLSDRERRARNAEYERQRRAEHVQAMALLAEAVGCDPNVASLEILKSAVRTIKSLRSSNGNLIREKKVCQQKLDVNRLAVKRLGIDRTVSINNDTQKSRVDCPEPLASTFIEANPNTINYEIDIKTSPVSDLTDSQNSPWFQSRSTESTPEYQLASYENSPDYQLVKTEDSPKYHLPASEISPDYHLSEGQVSPGYKFVPSENMPEYQFGASSISTGYQLASIVDSSNGFVTTDSSSDTQVVQSLNPSGQYSPLPQDINVNLASVVSSPIVDWNMFENGTDLLTEDFNIDTDFQWPTDNFITDLLHQ